MYQSRAPLTSYFFFLQSSISMRIRIYHCQPQFHTLHIQSLMTSEKKAFKLSKRDGSQQNDRTEEVGQHATPLASATTMTPPAKKAKLRPLPAGLLILAEKSVFQFVRVVKDTAINKLIGADSITMLPVSDAVRECNCDVFGDDNGMMRGLPMNLMMVPFMTTHAYCYMASMGGPYGDFLLTHRHPDTDTYTALNEATLMAWCRQADIAMADGDERDDMETPYSDAMRTALDTWRYDKSNSD